MSASNGVKLTEIVDALDKIVKEIDLDIAEARLLEQKAAWSALRFHKRRINELIENIVNA